MRVCMYKSLQVCQYVSMQVCKYVSMQVSKYVGIHVCKYEIYLCLFILKHHKLITTFFQSLLTL